MTAWTRRFTAEDVRDNRDDYFADTYFLPPAKGASCNLYFYEAKFDVGLKCRVTFQEDYATRQLSGVLINVLSPCCNAVYNDFFDFGGPDRHHCSACNGEVGDLGSDCALILNYDAAHLAGRVWPVTGGADPATIITGWLDTLGLADPLRSTIAAHEIVDEFTAHEYKGEAEHTYDLADLARRYARAK